MILPIDEPELNIFLYLRGSREHLYHDTILSFRSIRKTNTWLLFGV